MRGRTAYGFAIVLSIACLGAAHNPIQSEASKTAVRVPPTAAVSRTLKQAKPYQIGTASWYGDYFQGRATASGEPYDMYDMTAAHPSLPLGTWVRVTTAIIACLGTQRAVGGRCQRSVDSGGVPNRR